jgi:hypothetical protein
MAAAGAAHRLADMSTLGIVLIVIAAVLVLLLVGGFVGASRRQRHHEPDYARNLADADRALEQARAVDKGWDRSALEATARQALEGERPGWPYDELVLVLVDDKPGVTEDRAHFVASGDGGDARVVLARRDSGWAIERVE